MFPAAPTYAVYAAVIAGDWAWSVVSTCLMRRIKDIPKPQLARDVACIVLCYVAPMLAAAAAEVTKQVRMGGCPATDIRVTAVQKTAEVDKPVPADCTDTGSSCTGRLVSQCFDWPCLQYPRLHWTAFTSHTCRGTQGRRRVCWGPWCC